jgi:hypothetical protein
MTTYQNANDRPAGVTSEGRLMVEGVLRDYSYHVTAENEMGFTVQQTVTPVTGADVFLTVQNTHDRPLLVQQIRINDALAAGEYVNFMIGANWVIGGTHAAVEPVNRFISSTLLASSYATIEQGVTLTGHTGVTFHTAQMVANVARVIDFKNRPVILAQNRAFDLEVETGAANSIRVEVDFMWLEPADYVDN